GGIDPDIVVEDRNLAPITLILMSKGLLFDYATQYYYSHESIAGADSFILSEKEFSDFLTWLQDKEYDYITRVEKSLDEVIELSKKEKFNGVVENTLKELKSKIQHNKDNDLQKFKEEIKGVLEEEIAARYFLNKGVIESSFDSDPQLQEAIKVLNNQPSYDELLARQ
ncbi:MAG: peptidase S41, partial [Cyclobacteriaceae bacterium]|nr:peptidase S41 [Cyclobacteriaceae bacterium]